MKANNALNLSVFCSQCYEVLCSECIAGKAHNTTYLSLEMAFRKILENFELQKKYKR